MPNKPFRHILFAIIIAVALGLVLNAGRIDIMTVARAVAEGFPTATPAVGVTQETDSDNLQTLDGQGATQAGLALQTAIPQIPFRVRLPTYLPPGMVIYRTDVQLFGTDEQEANLDVFYMSQTGPDQMVLHIYETNQGIGEKQPGDATRHWSNQGTVTIGSYTWDYELLTYPQPNGSSPQRHSFTHTFSDGVYVNATMRVGTNSASALEQLKLVLASLEPVPIPPITPPCNIKGIYICTVGPLETPTLPAP